MYLIAILNPGPNGNKQWIFCRLRTIRFIWRRNAIFMQMTTRSSDVGLAQYRATELAGVQIFVHKTASGGYSVFCRFGSMGSRVQRLQTHLQNLYGKLISWQWGCMAICRKTLRENPSWKLSILYVHIHVKCLCKVDISLTNNIIYINIINAESGSKD